MLCSTRAPSTARWLRLAVVLGAAIAFVAACSTYGSDDDKPAPENDGGTPSSGDDGGGSSSSGQVFDAGPGDDGSVDPVPALACPNAGRSCVQEPPSGWNGPLVFYDGDEDAVPKCPPEMNEARVDTHRGFHAPANPHTCSTCTCGPGSNQKCTPVLKTWDSTCATPMGQEVELSATGAVCAKLAVGGGYTIDLKATGGTCSPVGGYPALTPIPWDSKTRACGATNLLRTGCDPGKICTPDPPYPFRAKHCISRGGDQFCPTDSPYTDKVLTYVADEQRSCTKCECGPPENNCKGQSFKFDTGNCNGNFANTPIPLACTAPAGVTDQSIQILSATSITAKCAVTTNATATGTVGQGGATTLCCIP